VKIQVKLFAGAREAARRDEVEVDLPDAGARAADVLAALATRADPLGPVAQRSRVAVNRSFATEDTPIRAGDEVALIPPVGGG
jgi:molybdopterin converting factor subunit 1